MLSYVQKVIYKVTGKRGVTLDTDFVQDLDLNSFDIINIVSAFEDHFHTTIPTRDIWKLRRVKDVIDYLAKRGFKEP